MKSRTWKALLRFWAADRGLSIFLGLLILIIFVLPAFAPPALLSRLAGDVALSLLLVAGAVAMPEYRWMRFVVPPMTALALVVRWASIATSSAHLAAWREIFSLATLPAFALIVASRVFR